jgi:hypothetical protein
VNKSAKVVLVSSSVSLGLILLDHFGIRNQKTR